MSQHFDVILSVFSGAIKHDLVQLEVYCLVIFCLIMSVGSHQYTAPALSLE